MYAYFTDTIFNLRTKILADDLNITGARGMFC
jgi:hypothetical protein